MKINGLICCFLFSLICSLGFAFAQDTPGESQAEIEPLLTVTGRVISRGEDIVLITASAQGYILEQNETQEESFAKVKELVDTDVDVTLSCFDTGETKGFRIFDHQTKTARETNYMVLRVASLNQVEPGSKVTNLDISKPIDYQTFPKEITSPLRQIKGKISKCNFKSVIPTIELEGKEGFVLMLTSDTKATKFAGDELISFPPKDVLKEGDAVEVWYEEKGYQNIARIITILERLY